MVDKAEKTSKQEQKDKNMKGKKENIKKLERVYELQYLITGILEIEKKKIINEIFETNPSESLELKEPATVQHIGRKKKTHANQHMISEEIF